MNYLTHFHQMHFLIICFVFALPSPARANEQSVCSSKPFLLTNGTDGMKTIAIVGAQKQCPAQRKSYGLEFRLPRDGGRCENGLLICYSALLQRPYSSDEIANFKVKGSFAIDANKDNVSKECSELVTKDGHSFAANGTTNVLWRGIRLRTVPKMSTKHSVHFRLEASVAVHKQFYDFETDQRHFSIRFGEENQTNAGQLITQIFLKENEMPMVGAKENASAMQTDFFTYGGAFLTDYAGLWLLGQDMIPVKQQKLKLFISRDSGCTMEAWFFQPTDLPVPPEPAMRHIKTDIDCGRVMANDRVYIAERAKFREKWTDQVPKELPINCSSIRARHFHFERPPRNDAEAHFPLAFVRLVFQDFLLVEMELATSYSPQNWYCYSVDKKSPPEFHRQMNALAKCLPNVMLTSTEYNMDSAGHYLLIAMMDCLKMLIKKNWHYVILLQNHDVQIKTNTELVQIFKWMNGTNDMAFTHIGTRNIDFSKNNWTLAHLKLYKNASKNSANLALTKNKGQSSMSLARKYVEWLLNELDTSKMLEQLNTYAYGNDEVFFQTLAANEFLGAPGGFTQHCFHKALAPALTRLSIWYIRNIKAECHSKMVRHDLCVLGLEDLVPTLLNESNPFMFANKMMLTKDAQAVQCWYELMYNRTILQPPTLERLNKDFYTELPQVRYNRDKANGKLTNASQFNCRYKYIDQVKRYNQLEGEYDDKTLYKQMGVLDESAERNHLKTK